jgi:hypothetical protein
MGVCTLWDKMNVLQIENSDIWKILWYSQLPEWNIVQDVQHSYLVGVRLGVTFFSKIKPQRAVRAKMKVSSHFKSWQMKSNSKKFTVNSRVEHCAGHSTFYLTWF